MNERIKDLAEQAANEIADLFSPGFFDDRMVNDVAEINKKFAELIVRECCEISDKAERAESAVFASKFIKAHFGVEE